MLTLEIDFSGLGGGAISASAVAQRYLGSPETPIRAGEGSGLAEISAILGVAPPEALKRVSLVLALAVAQVYLGGRETRIRARKSSVNAEISVLQGRTTHRNHNT